MLVSFQKYDLDKKIESYFNGKRYESIDESGVAPWLLYLPFMIIDVERMEVHL